MSPRVAKAMDEAPPTQTPTDGRRARGMRSRATILERSVQMASRDGLEGLTMGGLASELDIPKSNVFALFGSKQELQLATLAAARRILIEHVVAPAAPLEEGETRLRALGNAWFDYLTSNVFAGGCFLCAASAEMDGRPGPVRDAVAEAMYEWIALLRTNVETAVASHEFKQATNPTAMAFRLNALGMAANWQHQLFDDTSGVDHARAAWSGELDNARP